MEEKYVVYVGTYTHENSIGIHLYDLDAKSGEMKERKVVPINNPSDLLVSKDGRFLYSIADEGVEAFHILPDGDLEPMNKQWIGGMRASIYNAMPYEGVEALVAFMKKFEEENL